jgi:hypothetical protein
MTRETAYRVNTERFAHETVDGEVIVIDMDEGNYFSMRASAARIWQLVGQGHSAGAIVAALEASAGGVPRQEIEAGVSALLGQLAEEGILQPASPDEANTAPEQIPAEPFTTPVLQKYTEMQDLLTLDPIHEVDETGWPNRSRPNET